MSYEFQGNDRFEVVGHLGSGTSGDVYRCLDHKQGTVVALKTLHKGDPAAIYRFKKEFRALADVAHPNLVQLYELLGDGDRWYFTMELVDGLDFIDHTRSQPGLEGASDRFYSLPTPTAPADPERLRDALRQLAEGLAHLHGLGMLHCDVKPSNLRVTAAGRVVILDFGLVKELPAGQLYETLDGEVAGTPAYMSPEQAAGKGVTTASDWYSVGVVLYEALTGRIPFTGGFLKVLSDKQKLDPPSPRDVVSEAPTDLSALCSELLRRHPDERPAGRAVLERLGGKTLRPPAARATHGSSTTAHSFFVGRDEERRRLHAALARSREGRTVVAFVHAGSGMGKTALLRRFLHEARAQNEGAVLLAGRCYQRESVPYKAFDALIDALSRYLRQLPRGEAEVLMPTNVLALARLFPALRRVPAVAGAERRVLEIPDSREQRRRAFAALRELLGRIGERRPLVLWIDDLQWGDLDSAALLSELLRPPDPPAMLLVSCYRSEERESSPLLQSLLAGDGATGGEKASEIYLAPLSAADAETMVLELLGDKSDVARSLARTIARESGGSPFFIDELVRHARVEAGLDEGGDRSLSTEVERALATHMSLDRLIQARLERLGDDARRLLEVIAVAGQPIDLEAAREAAALGRELAVAIAALRGSSLARLHGSREREEIEAYHERIREAVLRGLAPEALAGLHRRLALALEGSGRADPETLAVHYLEAGERERAAEFAARAADRAAEALAFDRAARLYRIALDLEIGTGEALRDLRVRLGDALSNAGRGAEAATVYLAAAEGALAAFALELRRRAAEQLLISGHIDEGLATVRTVLASIGLRFPETPRQALFALAAQLVRLKLRGQRFVERDPSQIAPETLIAIDTCWSVSIGLGTVDTIRGMGFGKRHLLLALEAGEPYRVARAFAIESGYSATGGNKATARTAALVQVARTLAERVGNPHAIGLSSMTAGMAAYLEGQWKRAVELLDRGETVLRESCTGVTWELDTAMAYQLRALLFMGALGEIRRRLPRALEDVREKGDLYAEVNLRSRVVWVALLADDRPEEAKREVEEAIERWTPHGFHIQHYWHLTGRVEIALYRGDRRGAWEALDEGWKRMERSMLLRIQLTRTEALHTRCRAALAAAVDAGAGSSDAARHLRVVEAAADRIEREGLAWAAPLVHLVWAGVSSLGDERETTLDRLVAAAAGFESAGMELYAAAARLRRGQLLGRDRGRTLLQEATAAIAGQGVKDVGRFADVLAPGRWGPPGEA